MKKVLIVVLVLAGVVFATWKFGFSGKKNTVESGNRLTAMVVSKHSDAFNRSMQEVMDSYYAMTEGFVNWDTVEVNKQGEKLVRALDSLQIREMEKDTAIYPTALQQWDAIKTEAGGLVSDGGLTEKRASLSLLSQQLFDFLRIVQYDLSVVYFQECPMALNDYETAGNWLSKEAETEKRRNPFLGLKDPKYGKSMLTCGEVKTKVDYMAKDTSGTK